MVFQQTNYHCQQFVQDWSNSYLHNIYSMMVGYSKPPLQVTVQIIANKGPRFPEII